MLPKVDPSLHSVIQQILEGRQISAEGVQAYLQNLKSLDRYDSAFNLLWLKMLEKGDNPLKTTMDKVAEAILLLNNDSASQARNAYAACICIPGFEQLRFHQLLAKCKRSWNQNTPKYPIFWDGAKIIDRISQKALDWDDVGQLRDRLIICMRILGLFRSIDLERWYRKLSFVDNIPFIYVHRKGWASPRWEQLICIKEKPELCPFALLRHYVFLTRDCNATNVLLTLKKPFKPIKADTVGSITKRILQENGVPPQLWGAHSTRGAGVTMYKNLGLSSEQVCEIGQWKNSTAFQNHYLRIGARSTAAQKIERLVHIVSPMSEAEPERSRTPPNAYYEVGGIDLEGEAQDRGEPTQPSLKKRKVRSPRHDDEVSPPPTKFAFKRAAPPTTVSQQ